MTGILVAAIIIGLLVLVGGFALFVLLPAFFAFVGVLALIAVMSVVAVLMVPNFITLDDFKPEIINMLREATGREIAIGGPIGFTVWPVLGLQLKDISIGNPRGSKDPIMLAAQQLGVGVTLSSLMEHRLELRELRIVGGQLNLSTDARGRGNWNIQPDPDGEKSTPASDGDDTAAADGNQSEAFSIKDIAIEKIEVLDTNISYDSAGGTPVDLDNIDMTVSMPSLDKPLSVSGGLTLRDREIRLQGTLGKPRAVMNGENTPVNVTFSIGGDQVKLHGSAGTGNFKGDLSVKVGDLGQLAGWIANSPAHLPVRTLALSGKLDASSSRAELSGMHMSVDDMTVSGQATAQWSGARPRVNMDVDVSQLNLDRFMGDGSAAPVQSGSAASSGAGQAPDLSVLDKVNADITARLAGLVVKGAQLGATTLHATINNGALQASTSPADFYSGTVAVKTGVTAAGRGSRSFTSNIVLAGVDIEPVLKQFAGSDRLSGRGDLTLNLNGPVAAPDVIKRELGGTGNFMFRNGALKGVNIAGLIRNAKSVLSRQAQDSSSGPVETDFTELSGTFRIDNGVVSNNDLKMLSPLVRVTGRGTASLPQDDVNYRIEAALVADLTGQGGVLDRKGLVIPVNVRGPFGNLRYQPDLQGLVLGNVGAAQDIGNAVRDLGTKEGQRNARDTIKGMLGLPTSQQQEAAPAAPVAEGTATSPEAPAAPTEQAAPAPEPAQPQPADILRGLLTR